VLPFARVAVAVYWRLVPIASDVGAAGVMAIDTTGAGTTVAVVLPTTLPLVADIVTGLVVAFTPVATPLTVMVILVVSDDAQFTLLVMFCVVESLKVPVAVNTCWVW
jgi:hypothetical protein